jgi:ABC-type cobalt transport system substrate-binding protein
MNFNSLFSTIALFIILIGLILLPFYIAPHNADFGGADSKLKKQ